METETITAGQIRVGDAIEITREWPEGGMSIRGTVTAVDAGAVHLGQGGTWYTDALSVGGLSHQSTIRRSRQSTPEPEAPAVVRHAGRVLTRAEHDDDGNRWGVHSGPLALTGENCAWLTWAQVLALDPTTDPVLIDLGGGA